MAHICPVCGQPCDCHDTVDYDIREFDKDGMALDYCLCCGEEEDIFEEES